MIDNIKLQEEIIKADNKSVEKLWKNKVENNTLEALLEKMTKDELIKIAKKYSVKGITTLKKAEAVERVGNVILERYDEILYALDKDTLNFLKNLVNDKGVKQYKCNDLIYSNYLRNRGIAFTGTIDEELFVLLPTEMISLLENALNKDLVNKAKENSEIIKSIAGMTYYYGVLGFVEIKNILDRVFLKNIDLETIKELVFNGQELGCDYIVEDEIIYHIDVEDVENVLNLQAKNNREYYKFDKKTLIRAGEPDFIENNKQGEKLQKVIEELFVIDKNILKEEMDSFIVAIKNEIDVNEAIEIFLEAYEIESSEERNIFVEELKIFANNIRRWSLRGYTEEETEKQDKRVVNDVKVGRNDPCICGSGKKYKKCCSK